MDRPQQGRRKDPTEKCDDKASCAMVPIAKNTVVENRIELGECKLIFSTLQSKGMQSI